jgi:hypothetical protein
MTSIGVTYRFDRLYSTNGSDLRPVSLRTIGHEVVLEQTGNSQHRYLTASDHRGIVAEYTIVLPTSTRAAAVNDSIVATSSSAQAGRGVDAKKARRELMLEAAMKRMPPSDSTS